MEWRAEETAGELSRREVGGSLPGGLQDGAQDPEAAEVFPAGKHHIENQKPTAAPDPTVKNEATNNSRESKELCAERNVTKSLIGSPVTNTDVITV